MKTDETEIQYIRWKFVFRVCLLLLGYLAGADVKKAARDLMENGSITFREEI